MCGLCNEAPVSFDVGRRGFLAGGEAEGLGGTIRKRAHLGTDAGVTGAGVGRAAEQSQ